MKIVRSISVFVVALALLTPTPTLAQHTRLIFATDHGIWVPATDSQLIRVTIGNPYLAAPAGDDPASADRYLIEIRGVKGDVSETRIGPGTAFKYIVDPRVDGVLVDPKTGLRHVRVSFQTVAEAIDGRPAPRPSITIEVVHARTGVVESFHAFPGFTGGLSVAAGDVD